MRYFESELGDEHFPAPGAAYGLRLQAWGGALVCTNGMHRLVAGACWLASRQDDDAIFRKVRVRHYALREAAVDMMADARRRGEWVDAVHNTDCVTVAIRTRTAQRCRYWHLDGEEVVAVPADRLRRCAGLPARADRQLRWQRVPSAVIDAVANDGWLRTQLDSPRYPDQRTIEHNG